MRTAEHDGYLRGKPSLAFENVTQSLNLSHHHPLLSALQRPPSAGRGAPVQRETKGRSTQKARMEGASGSSAELILRLDDERLCPCCCFSRVFLPLLPNQKNQKKENAGRL